MKPAMTANEWEWHGTERLDGLDVLHGLIHGAESPEKVEEYVHALAALALYGQPFGFTREDVEHLRTLEHTGVWPISVTSGSLADRIEALLPPEGT